MEPETKPGMWKIMSRFGSGFWGVPGVSFIYFM